LQANDPAFFATARRCLTKDGLLLLETMGNNQRGQLLEPWLEKHILGQASLPSLGDITAHAQPHFVIEDVHNLGADHDRTLLQWHQRFEAAWPQLRLAYDERFYRMWRYHLLASAGSFRARNTQIWQMVMSPKGLASVYRRAY
jgi:cyclopropane-fatty-acyl-phospholipid synthase